MIDLKQDVGRFGNRFGRTWGETSRIDVRVFIDMKRILEIGV